MLTKRILTGLTLIGITIVSMLVDWACGLVIALFVLIGLYEFFTMLEHKGIRIFKYFGIAIGMIIPLSITFRFELTKSWELLFIMLVLLSLIVMQFRVRESSGAVVDISTTLFGILYVSWFFSFLIKIRYMAGGLGLLGAVILITKSCDIGAYLIGSRFGKVPLIPRISPKKSVEGAMGGVIFSLLAALASQPLLGLSIFHTLILGVCLGILGQLGDLSESLIKRDCQVKDSGVILPGMGGLLDVMDSLLFTAPAFYFYMSILKK